MTAISATLAFYGEPIPKGTSKRMTMKPLVNKESLKDLQGSQVLHY